MSRFSLGRVLGSVAAAVLLGQAVARRRRRISFRDRVVVITGGSRGLGLVIARRMAAEGPRLALLARDPQELERARLDLLTRGAEPLLVTCDMRDGRAVGDAMREVASHFGRLDVLVNNAGIIQVGPLEHMTPEDFENAMRFTCGGRCMP